MLTKAVEFFIPPMPGTDSELQRRVHLIASALFITTIFSIFYIVISWLSGFFMGMIIMGASFVFFVLLLILLRNKVNLFVVANLFGLSGIVAISGCIYFSGGLASPILPWLATTPVVILLLAGKKSGYFWAAVSVIIIIFFTISSHLGYQFPRRIAKDSFILALSCNVGLVLIITFISVVFENVRISAFNVVSSQNDALQQTLSELKTTQAQLIQSEKMASLGELTAGIAHEIQNPLNFVNNFSELNNELADELQQEFDSGNVKEAADILNNMKENNQKIRYHGNRADGIVKGMMMHSGRVAGHKEFADINASCDECLRLTYHTLYTKDKVFNAEYKTDYDVNAGEINIVTQDITRVLLNLLNNAFYSVKTARSLKGEQYQPLVCLSTKKITTAPGNDCIEIRVTDNGLGIRADITDKIFQPFFTTKPTGQGTGLGLSIAYDIITKEHAGSITVETIEGKYAEFIVQLPYDTSETA